MPVTDSNSPLSVQSGSPLCLDDDYSAWIRHSLERRRQQYVASSEPNLISLVTPAYNTPAEYLRALSHSIVQQDCGQDGLFEWVLLDNGSTEPATIKELQQSARHSFVRFSRVDQNLGIMGGMLHGVRRARGRYILPVDSDDYLYPDAIRVIASCIQENRYPALLYSDEDKVDGDTRFEAYLKPGWDPVLFLHSCYIAHLGAIDRGLAMMLGAYSDDKSRGCHDWDTFMQFMLAGYEPVHVPEVLYSWRRHAGSCAGNIDSKDYIHTSHQNTLHRFLSAATHPERYSLEYSPLFSRTPDWRIVRRSAEIPRIWNVALASSSRTVADKNAKNPLVLAYDQPVEALRDILRDKDPDLGLVRILTADGVPLFEDWLSESLTLLELFRDTIAVGGPVYDGSGRTLAGGIYFGFDGGCGSPDRLRPQSDPGYFAQMWKPHSVSAVSTQHAVFDGAFLADALFSGLIPGSVPLACLGEWLGAVAARWQKRVVYSPFLAVRANDDWQNFWSEQERTRFSEMNRGCIPETRFYSRHLGLTPERAYMPVFPEDRILLEKGTASVVSMSGTGA
jgi:hypothetical protein